jgi:hypothetical protein
VTGVKRELNPPPAGKPFRTLVRGIKLSVFGDALPEKILALGGDGESTVGAEVNKNADLDKEAKPIMMDAAKEAIRQAVDMTVTKLKIGDEPAKVKKKKS